MKPVKETLEKEILHRIDELEGQLEYWSNQPKDENNLYWFLAQEHSNYKEFESLIEHYKRKNFYDRLQKEKYTPFRCTETDTPLLIGDKVETEKMGNKYCGILHFDDYLNAYVIRTQGGGNIKFKELRKIDELYDYEISQEAGECRRDKSQKW